MRTKPVLLSLLITMLVIDFCTTSKAQAYLDPGTGSFILQAVIGVVFAAFLAIKVFWFRIKNAMAQFFKHSDHSND